MIYSSFRTLSKITLAAIFAATSATAMVATQAANPAVPGAMDASPLAGTSQPASAQGDPHYRHGWYAWHGRYWHHRRWHAGYWGPYHRWHSGFWVYF
jgi:hypothetical protein